MILYDFLNNYFPPTVSMVLAVLGYALVLFLIFMSYSSVNADLRYANI